GPLERRQRFRRQVLLQLRPTVGVAGAPSPARITHPSRRVVTWQSLDDVRGVIGRKTALAKEAPDAPRDRVLASGRVMRLANGDDAIELFDRRDHFGFVDHYRRALRLGRYERKHLVDIDGGAGEFVELTIRCAHEAPDVE